MRWQRKKCNSIRPPFFLHYTIIKVFLSYMPLIMAPSQRVKRREKRKLSEFRSVERRSETKPKILTFPLPNRKMMITCTSALLCENERCGQSTLLLYHLWKKKNFPSALMDLENLVAMISANLWNKTRSFATAQRRWNLSTNDERRPHTSAYSIHTHVWEMMPPTEEVASQKSLH